MPSSSVDTFLASSIMIILALSAMVGTSKLMAPYMSDLASRDDDTRFQFLASHLLLTTGTPTKWGQMKNTKPTSLGLAKASALQPYELDVDKVSRLNSENSYSLDYSDLWQAFGVKDVSFQVEIRPPFELSIESVSNSTQGTQTVYEFEVNARKSGMPVSASLSGYVAVRDFVNKTTASTSSNGAGTLMIGIPNSTNGTAVLLVFAQSTANAQVVSFSAFAFGHNVPSPLPNLTFTRLSPLDYVLNASLFYDSVEVTKAQAFTFDHNSSLTVKAQGVQTVEYVIPRLLDASTTVMVLTGFNGSTSFAEWVVYPQIPFQIGADFSGSIAGSRIAVHSRIVTINSALYEAVTRWGGLSDDV
ncbi:MAG TPA: hypothetical protein VJ249_03370 [Candidatus Bathyarchaeia archaeon]|nr:hypothetical protein [Candidatus Bathyarchaeia archaeon]